MNNVKLRPNKKNKEKLPKVCFVLVVITVIIIQISN